MTSPAPHPESSSPPDNFSDELGHILFPDDSFPGRRLLSRDILTRIAGTYDWTLARRGPTPKSVLWRNGGSQRMRFRQLLKVLEDDRRHTGLSINDLGCGYGALFGYARWRPFLWGGRYTGYDLCPRMIRAAEVRWPSPRARFIHAAEATVEADYSLASGTFGLCLDVPEDDWRRYAQDCLKSLAGKSRRGMAFNLLNARALDARPEDRRDTLYYADPDDWMEFCLRTFGKRVRLLNAYTPSDFTVLVRF